jgi:hypothetical protein
MLGDGETGWRRDLGGDELDLGDGHWAMKPGRLNLGGDGTWTVAEPGQ